MSYSIISPSASFVHFGSEAPAHCIWGENKLCLPVYAEDDIAFQFVIEADTPEEASALCTPYGSGIDIGIVKDCDQEAFDVEFTELPERYRISDRQVLFNWPHGLPGMNEAILVTECFFIRVVAGEDQFCSNCFQRIPEDCFTSVVEYGNGDNFGGFNYCNSEAVSSGGDETCEPEIVTFNNVDTLSIPYTTSLQDKFGIVPTVQVWIYNEAGELQNMGVVATFDNVPVSFINIDMGGNASGIVIIR